MNLDDLMDVWKSQDASPLHGVDKTLLHLALRQEQKKVQAGRHTEMWITGLATAFVLAAMAFFLAIMIYPNDMITGWDLAIPVTGAVSILLWAGAMYVRHRALALRERSFGESLRDQLNRHITQLDFQTTSAFSLANVLLVAVPGLICPMAILLAGSRINERSISDDGFLFIGMLFICVWSVAAGVWDQRRKVKRDVLPRRRRLEALLRELDGQ